MANKVDAVKAKEIIDAAALDGVKTEVKGEKSDRPWLNIDYEGPNSWMGAGAIYADGAFYLSGDARWDLIDVIRPICEKGT